METEWREPVTYEIVTNVIDYSIYSVDSLQSLRSRVNRIRMLFRMTESKEIENECFSNRKSYDDMGYDR